MTLTYRIAASISPVARGGVANKLGGTTTLPDGNPYIVQGHGPAATLEDLDTALNDTNTVGAATFWPIVFTGPLSIGWAVTGDLWPGQPEPMVCSGSFLTKVIAFDTGAPIAFIVDVTADDPLSATAAWSRLATFGGRITDLSATPHDLGQLISFSASDITATFADVRLTAAYPADDPFTTRITRVLASAYPGSTATDRTNMVAALPSSFTAPALGPIAAGQAPAAKDYLTNLLDWRVAATSGVGTSRFIYQQVASAVGLPLTSGVALGFDQVSKASSTVDKAISADLVAFDSTWVNTKRTAVNQVAASWTDTAGAGHVDTASNGGSPAVTADLSATDTMAATNTIMSVAAGFYLPAAASSRWQPQGFRYYLDAEPAAPAASIWFPDLQAAPVSASRVACYQNQLTITDMPVRTYPDQGALSTWTGRLTAVTAILNDTDDHPIVLDINARTA